MMNGHAISPSRAVVWALQVALSLSTCGALAPPGLAQQSPDPSVPVRVDERVELMSIVFRLAGAGEYTMAPGLASYVKEVDAHFGPFKDHAAIKLAARLRAERGIGFDAVASYAVHLRGGPQLEPKIPFDDPKSDLESRWSPEAAAEFLTALQQFADDTKAFEFFEDHREFYVAAAQRLETEIARRPYRQWLDGFFGGSAEAEFTGIVGLLNGGGNYGMKVVHPDGRLEILPIIGASRFDAAGLPIFNSNDAGTVAHEFCHSFCNPLVDRFADQLVPAGDKIFPFRETLMRPQAYSGGRTMLYESLVRACTHRFLCAHGNEREAAGDLQQEVSRGFLWTPALSALLHEYETSRDKYPTLESFMPRIVEFFDKLAGTIEERVAQLPHVVRMTPPNGAVDVDPALAQITIEFDRPMKPGGRAIVGRPTDTPPTAGTPHFADGDQVFLLPVRLIPGKTYKFSLNSINFSGFVSADGLPLDPVAVTFSTAEP